MALPDLAIVLVAAGRSARMGFDKLWAELAGRAVLAYALEAARAAQPSELVVVVAADRLDAARAAAPDARVVAGGERRRDSVQAGLRACRAPWVAVHDAARALAPAGQFALGLDAARQCGAAIPALPLRDTIKRVSGTQVVETLPRGDLVAAQTPQLFRRADLERALASTSDDVTDEAALVEWLGGAVATYPGHEDAFKITTPFDFDLALAVLARRQREAALVHGIPSSERRAPARERH